MNVHDCLVTANKPQYVISYPHESNHFKQKAIYLLWLSESESLWKEKNIFVCVHLSGT